MELRIVDESGHLVLLLPGGKRALVDTGSPISVAAEPFEFLGRVRQPVREIMGFSADRISELTGFKVDALIGTDLLGEQSIRIRWRDGVLEVSDDLPDGEQVAELALVAGIPVFALEVRGSRIRAFFDTGAHLSYIDPALVKDLPPGGERDDFHPMVGRYRAPVYELPVRMTPGTEPVDIEFGLIPAGLQPAMAMAMTMARASAVVGTRLLANYDCCIAWERCTISWTR